MQQFKLSNLVNFNENEINCIPGAHTKEFFNIIDEKFYCKNTYVIKCNVVSKFQSNRWCNIYFDDWEICLGSWLMKNLNATLYRNFRAIGQDLSWIRSYDQTTCWNIEILLSFLSIQSSCWRKSFLCLKKYRSFKMSLFWPSS